MRIVNIISRFQKEKRAQRKQDKLDSKDKQQESFEEEETTEQDQDMEATEEAESETESESARLEPDINPRGLTMFQLFCNHILRKLMEKDPEEYFTFPVSRYILYCSHIYCIHI